MLSNVNTAAIILHNQEIPSDIAPGAHVFVLGDEHDALRGRLAGLVMRDSVVVYVPGPEILKAFLLRKPLELTVAENMVKFGCGGLDVNRCRVKHSSPADFAKHKDMVDRIKAKGGSMANSWKNSSDLSGANEVTTAGRWPPNAIIVHGTGCRKEGGGKPWECQLDCPTVLLDEHDKDAGGASRFFPQFADIYGAIDWLAQLVGLRLS